MNAHYRFPYCRAVLLAMVLVTASASVAADDDWRQLHEAVRQGRLVALPSVLDWLQQRYTGQILEVELESDDQGAPRYDVEMIGPQGQVVRFEFDAATGELLDSQGSHIEAMKRR
ncbi:PepSY domain-containing protein [Modicisalibacter coralii]|uniref:PepSY domain-containing protein n=1 Tax=Modicisalibacter coralii TaxID=2304602 RepID=UPI00100ACB16|nr:PepSY domain-containing protein [Halomonas coralii]